MTDIQEFVVPKSMPKTFAIKLFFVFVCPLVPLWNRLGLLSNDSAVLIKFVKTVKRKGKMRISSGGNLFPTVPKETQWHTQAHNGTAGMAQA
jgi:hypothetical protein